MLAIGLHAMAEPPRKLARLQKFRSKLPFVSHRALVAILKAAAAEPLPELGSRRDIGRARDEVVRTETPYGPLHQTIAVELTAGGELTLEIQHPVAMLYQACATSKSFSRLVERTFAATPSSIAEPWGIILYADEILPGNQLGYKSARKMWGWYWTVLQFGPGAHADEDIKTWSHTWVVNSLNRCSRC